MDAYKVLDVGSFLLARQGSMGAMKLQKLVYYSQAWTLALQGRPLFCEEIQAWAYGPVVYELYVRHRGQFVVSRLDGAAELIEGSPAAGVVEGVLSYYGRLDGAALSKLTHAEDPWREARERVLPGAPSQAIIAADSMMRYYRRQVPPFPQR